MKKTLSLGVGIVIATLALGVAVQLLGGDALELPQKKITDRFGLSGFFWPFVLPVVGMLLMLGAFYSKPHTLREATDYGDGEKSTFIPNLSLLIGPALTLVMQAGIALYQFEWMDKEALMKLIIGLAFIFFLAMGNYVSTTKRGSPAGFRTPWSMYNDRIWLKTQRLLGHGLVCLTLAGLGLVLFINPLIVFWKFFIPVLVTLKISVAGYSYLLWRQEKRQQA